MLVGPDGEAVGSVSGGCVEGAVYELGEQVRADGRPVLQRYGVSDDDAFAVGLTCGGIIDLFVEKVDRATFPQLGEVAEAIAKEQPVAVATVVCGPPRAARHPAGRLAGPGRRQHRLRAAGRRRPRRRARPARRGPQRHAALRRRRAAPRRGPRRLRRVVRPAAADDRVRGDRLRRRGGARSARSSASGSPSATPARSSPPRRASRARTRSSSSGRTATWPRRREAGPDRRAHRAVRADPRPEVRRPAAGGRAAAARGRLHRRDGLAAHPRRPAGPAARARADRGGAGADVVARSGWTWARAPRRRRRCRSRRR